MRIRKGRTVLLSSSSSFSSVPDELVEKCLARIPKSDYPDLSTVSKRFHSLLSSKELYETRARLGNTENCLYVCVWDSICKVFQWHTLWIDRNQTEKKETLGELVVAVPSMSQAAVAIGPEIYVISGHRASTTVRVLDCRSHTWRVLPSMNVARDYSCVTCVFNGKIYVLGGVKVELPYGEVFDIKAQTWECLPDPPFALDIPRGPFDICDPSLINFSEVEGKIYVWDGKTKYAYDLEKGKWERCDERKGTVLVTSENVSCVMVDCDCHWYDIRDGKWKIVQGLDIYDFDTFAGDEEGEGSFLSMPTLVSFGGKLLAIWEEDMFVSAISKIWCAEIVIEKRGEGEIWGKVEWVNVVLTIPETSSFLHHLGVSL